MPSTANRRYKRLKARVLAAGMEPLDLAHGLEQEEAIVVFAAALGMPFPMAALDYDADLDELFTRKTQFPTLSGIDPLKEI